MVVSRGWPRVVVDNTKEPVAECHICQEAKPWFICDYETMVSPFAGFSLGLKRYTCEECFNAKPPPPKTEEG